MFLDLATSESMLALETKIIEKNARAVESSYNACRAVSYRLQDDLLSHRIQARVMRCSGLLLSAPDADRRWLELGHQSQWVHFVVQTNRQMIDLTRTQFFPESPHPFLQELATFGQEWTNICRDDLSRRFLSSY